MLRDESPHGHINNFSIKNSKNAAQLSQKTVMNLGKMYNKNIKIRDTTLQRFKEDDKERNGKKYKNEKMKILKMKNLLK